MKKKNNKNIVLKMGNDEFFLLEKATIYYSYNKELTKKDIKIIISILNGFKNFNTKAEELYAKLLKEEK